MKKFRMAIALWGGLGDFLLAANYMYHVVQKIGEDKLMLDVYCGERERKAGNIYAAFSGLRFFNAARTADNIPNNWGEHYDIALKIARFPQLLYIDAYEIEFVSAEVIEFAHAIRFFETLNPSFVRDCPVWDGQGMMHCLINGIHRVNQADVFGIAGMTRDSIYPLQSGVGDEDVLSSLNLKRKKYITIFRGSDATYGYDTVKIWPHDYYEKLLFLLKSRFPQYTLVQLGVSKERSPIMKGIDVQLVGKTNMNQLKVLLKNSALHIDSEGGMVHLRHFLCKEPSVVLFGATPMEFYEYGENINISAGVCHWCEWVAEKWYEKCMRGCESPLCMSALTPDIVFKRICAEKGRAW